METNRLTQLLSRFWWLLLFRGLVAILFGISAFAWPGLTLVTLVMLFAAYAFVDGIFEVVHAISHRQELGETESIGNGIPFTSVNSTEVRISLWPKR